MLTKAELLKITRQLGSFGCTDREARIYLQCLQMGPAPVQEIASQLSENRLTTHSAIEKLVRKGLLAESRKGKRRVIVAEPPEIFNVLVQKKFSELKVLEESVGHAPHPHVQEGSREREARALPACRAHRQRRRSRYALHECPSARIPH